VTVDEARAMIAPAGEWGGAAERWADLGCGRGTFTRALAGLLGDDSEIVAVDADRRALAALPREWEGTRIEPRHGTLGAFAPDTPLHGILMANVLHYEADPATRLAKLSGMLVPAGRLLLVEYDIETPVRPWVPHPVGSHRARTLLEAAGLRNIRQLASRPSLYHRGPLYAMAASR
jgi:2-polyprenyl-3-methyl-5-hydroxy-6-metoxy-1,4-benzoquinol methylase